MKSREEIARALHDVHVKFWTRPPTGIDMWDRVAEEDREGYRLQADAVLSMLATEHASLLTRVEAAEGALAAVRTYAVNATATCREAEQTRLADLRDPENHRVKDMLREQHFAWGEKAASYDALIAFIDALALRASGTREGV